MRILDLFCGAGGCSVGYHRAGFEVVGVDLHPQPNYPFEFHQCDALRFDIDYEVVVLSDGHRSAVPRLPAFDAIHASPPCQSHTGMSNRWRGHGGKADSHIDLIPETRRLLIATGLPYVIENVTGARRALHDPISISGGHFGLGVERRRLFESNIPLKGVPYVRVPHSIGVYGKHHDGRLLWRRKDGTEQRCARTLDEGRHAMGIDWMQWRELCESIPPDYTEHIGRQLLAHLAPVTDSDLLARGA